MNPLMALPRSASKPGFELRRRLVGFAKRMTSWEFLPAWIAYLPVVPYLLVLGLKNRSLTLFTAANPGIEAGGFINESKATILDGLEAAGDVVPPWKLLPAAWDAPARLEGVRRFVADGGLTFPIVLKPDAGQRGSGVIVARSWAAVDAYLERARYDVIAQAYVPGEEYGVFYVRRPREDRGFIFAVTEKRMPTVVGDGRRTLEELILADARAVAMASTYLEVQVARLREVVPAGESVQLVEIPTHQETDDNIVAMWVPADTPSAGQERAFAYRIRWPVEEPLATDLV